MATHTNQEILEAALQKEPVIKRISAALGWKYNTVYYAFRRGQLSQRLRAAMLLWLAREGTPMNSEIQEHATVARDIRENSHEGQENRTPDGDSDWAGDCRGDIEI